MPLIKKAIHPTGDTILFQEKFHIYKSLRFPQLRFVSGTGFLKRFIPEFKKDEIATRCAKKEGRTKEEIIADWNDRGFIARNIGTLVHQFAEDWLDNTKENPKIEDISHSDQRITDGARLKATVLIPALGKIQEEYEIIALEEIIASHDLKIAGMVDLRAVNKKTGQMTLLDYKTNKEIKFDNRWATLLPPLELYDDANFIHYSLQLALYEYIGIKEGYYERGDQGVERILVHVTEDDVEFLSCPDLQAEIDAMLKAT